MKNTVIDDCAMMRFQQRVMKNVLPSTHVYHEFVASLLARLDYIRIAPNHIVNFAWHTEYAHTYLTQKYPQASVIDVHTVSALNALSENSVDCVVAYFSFFCHENPQQIIQACHRVLREEGLLLFVD